MSKLLLINDLAGYGKVALSAMIPILSHMQYEVCSLPTALVSNTLDYGKFEVLETTDYMKNTLQVWDALGFQFDAVSTGFIVSRPQTELVRDFCRAQKVKGTRIFTDPIMGDEGKLYNGIGEETVALMRELVAAADYIVPNYTEASYLAGVPYQCGGTTREELYALADKLHALGAGAVLITSARMLVDGGWGPIACVVGYDAAADQHFILPYEELPVRFPGTGDIFSAVFMGHILRGDALKAAWRMWCYEPPARENHPHRPQRPGGLPPRPPGGRQLGLRQPARRDLPHGDARRVFVHRHPALRRQHPGPKPWQGNFQLPRRRHAEHF